MHIYVCVCVYDCLAAGLLLPLGEPTKPVLLSPLDRPNLYSRKNAFSLTFLVLIVWCHFNYSCWPFINGFFFSDIDSVFLFVTEF
jgi:hypothetical protein